jgi:hypothetical protein
LEALGSVSEENGSIKMNGLLGRLYEKITTVNPAGKFALRDDIRKLFPQISLGTTNSGNPGVFEIEKRDPGKDGSVSQISVFPVFSSMDIPAAQDPRAALIAELIDSINNKQGLPGTKETLMSAVFSALNKFGLFIILPAYPRLLAPLGILFIGGWILNMSIVAGKWISEKIKVLEHKYQFLSRIPKLARKNMAFILPAAIVIPLMHYAIPALGYKNISLHDHIYKVAAAFAVAFLATWISEAKVSGGGKAPLTGQMRKVVNSPRGMRNILHWSIKSLLTSYYRYVFLIGFFMAGYFKPALAGENHIVGILARVVFDVGFVSPLVTLGLRIFTMELAIHKMALRDLFMGGYENISFKNILKNLRERYTKLLGYNTLYWTIAMSIGWALDDFLNIYFPFFQVSNILILLHAFVFSTIWNMYIYDYFAKTENVEPSPVLVTKEMMLDDLLNEQHPPAYAKPAASGSYAAGSWFYGKFLKKVFGSYTTCRAGQFERNPAVRHPMDRKLYRHNSPLFSVYYPQPFIDHFILRLCRIFALPFNLQLHFRHRHGRQRAADKRNAWNGR